jgi:hypothetical protein
MKFNWRKSDRGTKQSLNSSVKGKRKGSKNWKGLTESRKHARDRRKRPRLRRLRLNWLSRDVGLRLRIGKSLNKPQSRERSIFNVRGKLCKGRTIASVNRKSSSSKQNVS